MKPAANKPDKETLRDLYIEQRMTTRQIGARYGVAHITIRRWMNAYGIPPRASGDRLSIRGLEMPPADELYELVHVQHLGYRQIASKYHVDFTCIPYWLDKYEIPRPKVWTTRRKGRQLPSPSVASATRLPSVERLGCG